MRTTKIVLFISVVAVGLFLVVASYTNRDTFTYAAQAPMFALIAATLASIRLLPAQINNALFDVSLRVTTVGSGFLAGFYWLLSSEDANFLHLLLVIFLTGISGFCLFLVPQLLARQLQEGEKDG